MQKLQDVLKKSGDRAHATNPEGLVIEVAAWDVWDTLNLANATYSYEQEPPKNLTELIQQAQDEERYEDASRLLFNGIQTARHFEALTEELMDEYGLDVNAPIWELMPEEVTA